MITSERNLMDSLNFLIEESETFNRKIDNDMNATAINNLFKDIESHINKLYEKMRVLEDVKDYIKTFTVKAIQERRNKIINDQKVIEASADRSNGSKSITEVINFNSYNQYITDRNGDKIEALDNINGKLILPSKLVNKENLVGIVNKGQLKDNEDELVNISQAEEMNEMIFSSISCKPLVGVYESYDTANGGIINEYEISFDSRANCNKIEFDPINCEVIKVTVTTFDGKVSEIDTSHTYLDEPIDIEKMNVLVKCTNYDYNNVSFVDGPIEDSFDNSLTEVLL